MGRRRPVLHTESLHALLYHNFTFCRGLNELMDCFFFRCQRGDLPRNSLG